MFFTLDRLRPQLLAVIQDKARQGHVTEGLEAALQALPDSYDAHFDFARRLANLPFRADWPYHEPNGLDEIKAACGESWDLPTVAVDHQMAASKVEAAFLGSICGCVLGKPLEVAPTLAELRSAFEPLGEWPLRDYVSGAMLDALGRRHASAPATVRENIAWVEPDDDINYTILGLLILEKNGVHFTKEDVRRAWIDHVCCGMTWGPERTVLMKALVHHTFGSDGPPEVDEWSRVLNRGDELCGAQIRADAYGYACPANPALAAELAWRDASFTHNRTGIYATMWTAAAIAAAFTAREPLEIFEIANRFVPPESRFYNVVSTALSEVRQSTDWMDGYERIHDKFGEYGHCLVYQESGTLINTLRWATSVDDGFCKQVMQGNDTDSYGATAGSILGAYFGPGHLDARWLAPFNDDIRTGLAQFHERSLARLAQRMAQLPHVVTGGPRHGTTVRDGIALDAVTGAAKS